MDEGRGKEKNVEIFEWLYGQSDLSVVLWGEERHFFPSEWIH